MENSIVQLRHIYQDASILLRDRSYAPGYGNSLLKGPWGVLLFMFYYEQYADQREDQAAELLETLYADYLPETGDNYAFCSGHTGPFWLLDHLNRHAFVELDMTYLAADLITVAIRESEHYIAARNFDFLHGSTGICNFLLGSVDRTAVKSHLEQFVNALAAISEVTDQGRSLPVFKAHDPSLGVHVNAFSLAHGSCSVLIVLCRIYAAGIATDACRQLIRESIAFILQHKNIVADDPHHSLYPAILDGKGDNSRLSWCYGDLGVAIALWRCGKTLEEPAWQNEALAIMHYNIHRSTDDSAGIVDSCFCHGAAGIAAFYRRFWFETKDVSFKEAALHWHKRAMATLSFSAEDDQHGIKVWQGEHRQWDYAWDLLDGSCGVGLSILSHLHDSPLGWDECFLLS